jgi:flagellar protein FlaG
MIIQNSTQTNQAAQPAARVQAAVPVKAVAVAPVAETPAQNAPVQPSPSELKSAVAAINNVMRQSNLNLEFSVDTDTRETVVKMVDTSTGELIRQFPSEATLAISRGIEQFQQGMLLTQKA